MNARVSRETPLRSQPDEIPCSFSVCDKLTLSSRLPLRYIYHKNIFGVLAYFICVSSLMKVGVFLICFTDWETDNQTEHDVINIIITTNSLKIIFKKRLRLNKIKRFSYIKNSL